MKMYCVTINDEHYDKIKKLGYEPVGLGNKIISKNFLKDDTKNNISKKNPYYGEYTFHYWLWKNNIINSEDKWIGFCQYRKFWTIGSQKINIKSLKDLNNNIIKEIPSIYKDYESILGEPLFINQFRLSKFFKKNLKEIILSPSLLFNKNKRNIKFHFDMMHGYGNLNKAINLLNINDRDDFRNFVNTEVSFNPHNMFICKSSKTLIKYYNSVFTWLEKCENEFGFDLDGYGLKRIYGFLAERYMSFWFKKYTRSATLPIIFKDITDLN
jgi:hypothetical protein